MNPALILITFLVLFAIVLVAISLGFRFLEIQRKKQVEGMLQVVDGKSPEAEQTSILVDRSQSDPLQAFFKKSRALDNINTMLQQAGLSWSPTRLFALMIVLTVAGVALGWVLTPLGFVVLSALAFGLFLGSLPYLYVRFKRTRRMAEIEQQLPESLDFLARSMKAGHAFSISLEMLGAETPDPLGQEFRTLFNEQNLGAPIDTALTNFSERVPLLDVRMFVSSVLLQKQTGGNLSEILTRLAYVIRERFRLRGQVRVASAHGRLTAGVLTILPLALVVALMFVAPGYLQSMADDPDGKWLIVGAILAQIAGYIIMRRITNIKV